MSYLSACGDSSEPEGPVVSGAGLRIHQGDQQTALAGSVVAVQPAVKVVDVHGEAQEGVAVSFYVGVGGGVVSHGKVKTGKDGVARVKKWQLGEVGENTLIAAAGTIGSVTFEALALGPTGSGLVQNADFGANTGRWPHGSGPSGWAALLELPGTEAVVEESSEAESGNLLRFSQLGERFGETRIDQCVRLEGQARLHLFAVVKVDKPHNDLRIRLNSDIYGSEEDCQKDKAETRIGEQTRSDFKLGPAEELSKNQWRAFSTIIAYDPQSPAYARISLRARDRSGPGKDGKAAKLWIDRIDLVEKQSAWPTTAIPVLRAIEGEKVVELEAECDTEGAQIYISKNGRIPIVDPEFLYKGPFKIEPGQLIRALAVAAGHSPSDVLSRSFSAIVEPRREFPQVHLHTFGEAIVDREVRIPGEIQIRGDLSNSWQGAELYEGRVGVRGRGNTSWTMSPKQPLNLELWTVGKETNPAPVLGMPVEEDWILVPNYFDKTLLRSWIAYEFSRMLGRYAPRMRHVELFVNSSYEGLYLLAERPKRGSDRINIQKISDEDVSGGYILEVRSSDRLRGSESFKTSRGIRLAFNYPKEPNQDQRDYISNYINEMEAALYDSSEGGEWEEYLDPDALIDWLLVNELARNNDARFIASVKMYKDRDGKLVIAPVWDFDIGWGNIDYTNSYYPDGWGIIVSGWFGRAMEREDFRRRFVERWWEIHELVKSLKIIFDAEAEMIRPAAMRNFERWPIIGTAVWPNPKPIPQSWDGDLDQFRNWLDERIEWLESNMDGLLVAPPEQDLRDAPRDNQ